MSPSEDMTKILEELSAGRIDPAEAARRIDAISTTNPEANADPAADSDPLVTDRSGADGATTAGASSAGSVADDVTSVGADAPDSDASDAGSSDPVVAESVTADSAAVSGDDAASPADDATSAPSATTDATDTDETEEGETDGGATDGGETAGDAWAASTDRPQQPSYGKESVRPSRPKNRLGRRPAGTNGVEKLSVRAVGRRVRIIGEPSVATVSADGPHVLRRNGSVLEISSDGEFGASIDGFQLLKATRSLDDFRSLGLGKELLLRVNPALLVDIEVTAGSLNTEGVPRLGSVRVTAGGAKLLDVAEIADALIQAGQATVKGAITTGRSRIRVESGSLSLQLSDASNVTIATESQLGKISWGGAHAGFVGDEVVMGHGSARLDVEVVMGHASVKAGTAGARDDDPGAA